MEQITRTITQAITDLYGQTPTVRLDRPDPQFGDYATNVAMQLAKPLGKNPRQIAEQIAEKLQQNSTFAAVSVAGPGFINLTLSDSALVNLITTQLPQTMLGQTIVTEYSDPNPFKVLHAGHLYTTVVGDAISRLFELAGANVHRTNFGGDVGLHVARNMWGIIQYLGGEHPEKLQTIDEDLHKKAAWLSARYVEGNTAYEENEQAKAEIIEYNKRVYQLHEQNDHDSSFAQIYWTCRQWSYDYFDLLYRELQVAPFEKYYPESLTTPLGLSTVKSHVGDVYTESDGAIVFKGEDYGLHTRVFINSAGLPTYEAKDVGLIMHKWQDYAFDKSVVITGNDITEYMKVVLKSIERYEPDLVARTTHLTHGNIKLAGGKKMSSRKGNVVLALDVLDAAAKAQQGFTGSSDSNIMLGAVKYAFLSARIGSDIVYDPEQSVSIHGNSGPYLQYAHARSCSILAKSTAGQSNLHDLKDQERALARKLSEYNEVAARAIADLMPHYICTYLYELAQEFNRFYEQCQVIGSNREAERVTLVALYRDTLARGLSVLGIYAPQKM